ncbi:MarR family transcriptional regulator [Mycobacterium sp. M26]|uniref:MarR family winged helix-turn-helix transcriptional regulator n=1 Tax=Mycobacterium sp. M26 TaxID=1762962 RepID=UPI00073E321C|nr:MarR family transcriptional regulator [Mycobacterium sp. M26]
MADDVALLVADVFELAGLLRRTGEAVAAQEGQTQARWQLLSVLSEEPLTVPQAARRLGITRQGVQRVVNDLVAAGLVEFADNPDHRTSPLAQLTAPGRRILVAITEQAAHENRRLADALGSTSLRATHDGVRRLIAALKS